MTGGSGQERAGQPADGVTLPAEGPDRDRLLRQTLDALPMAVYLRDATGRLLHLNPAARDLSAAFDVAPDQIAAAGRTPRGLVDHLDVVDDQGSPLSTDRLPVHACLADGQVHARTIGLTPPRADGQVEHPVLTRRWLHASAAPVELPDGTTGVVASYLDITAEHHLREELRDAALHDPLTGLANRRQLGEAFDRATAHAGRTGADIGLVSLDLDGFKVVNDNHGHDVGDRFLVEVAARLQAATRDTDTVARVGGDEFVVLCTHVDGELGLSAAGTRLATALDASIEVDGRRIPAVASVGWTLVPPGSPLEEAMHQADSAMYRDKARRHAT